ncbi:MAG: hypothetical protein LBI72_00795 [Flavobacteriaceae bacterium]|nr:hypothetical protein [Flavobacteriaceae bacterium]
MKESLNIVKTKFKHIQPLLKQGNLKDYHSVNNRLLLFKVYLLEIDKLLAQKPVKVNTWHTSVLKHYILPVLTDYFLMQEAFIIHHLFHHNTNDPMHTIVEYFQEIDDVIVHHSDAYSDYGLYCRGKISISYLLSKNHVIKRKDKSKVFSHSFKHFPQPLLLIAIGATIDTLLLYRNRILPLLNSKLTVITPLKWTATKQELSALICCLCECNLIENKKANRQAIANQFASLLGIDSFKIHRLFYNYRHSSQSTSNFRQFTSSVPLPCLIDI